MITMFIHWLAGRAKYFVALHKPLLRISMGATLGAAAAAQLLPAQSLSTDNSAFQWYQNPGPGTNPLIRDKFLCGPTVNAIRGTCGVAGFTVEAQSAALLGGVLKARVSANLSNVNLSLVSPPPTTPGALGVLVGARATVTDVVRFGALTPAVLRFSYHVDGQGTRTASGSNAFLNPGVNFSFGASQFGAPTPSTVFDQNFVGTNTGGGTLDRAGFIDFSVNGSTTLQFYLSLFSAVAISNADGQALSGFAESDFFNTAHIGVQALDASGNDITTLAQLQFGLGPYPEFAIQTVPEPSTYVLFGMGMLAVGCWSAYRKRATP